MDESEQQSIPDQVTVIVHNAKGLQGKKPGRHKYSVIFGFGNKKYRTSVVKDPKGNPVWNEESVLSINNSSDTLFFNVTEKDDILGQILVPIASLRGAKGRVICTALQPHKKNSKPKGSLIYQCYVSKYRESGEVDDKSKSRRNSWLTTNPFLTFKRSPGFSGNFFKKEHKSTSPLSNLNKRISRSFHDIFSLSKTDISDDEESEGAPSKLKTRSTFNLSCAGVEPEISYITPNTGSAAGGTRITIVGENLGLKKSDIVTLRICDVDVLSTLEYESSGQIYCETLPGPTGHGDVIIETSLGGKTVLTGGFTLVAARNKNPAPKPPESRPSSNLNKSLSHSTLALVTPPTQITISAPNSPKTRHGQNDSLNPFENPSMPNSPTASIESHKSSDTQLQTLGFNKKLIPPDPASVNKFSSLDRRKFPAQNNPRKNSKDLGENHGKGKKDTFLNIKENSKTKHGENIEGRFRKNFFKHMRTASDVPRVAVNDITLQNSNDDVSLQNGNDAAALQNGISEVTNNKEDWSEKAKFAELERLQKENTALRQENADMKAYIEKLLAKVLHHCPEALAADNELTLSQC
ncbi:exocyst complex component 2 [Octopus vulgaris]|uniref:Exocyst complex component 2 n=1 Tax=Octopus vulgaris TaxID=6645 RepID=A0AA36BB42_OCTVU|nr:exocyst complex component 2 [Octopus vulgaris]